MTNGLPYKSITARRTDCGNQSGMALVFALVVLLILTILGVSALRTSSLEQLMSGNVQDQTRAFEAADSGVGHALNVIQNANSADPTIYAASAPTKSIQYTYSPSGGTANMITTAEAHQPTFLQIAPVGRSSSPTGSSICAAYYDQVVRGSTTTFASSNLHQGLSVTGAHCPSSQ